MFSNYKLVEGDNLTTLAAAVLVQIGLGYQPVGGPIVVNAEAIAQAMVLGSPVPASAASIAGVADNLTATGTDAGSAFPIVAALNRFVASSSLGAPAGATLPAAVAGLAIVVISPQLYNMIIYPAGADDIDYQANLTQPLASTAAFYCAENGHWNSMALLKPASTADALTAVGTNRATSLALTADINRFTTAAGAPAGGTLPACSSGKTVRVINDGAGTMQVYAAGSDTIGAIAGATGIVLAIGGKAQFVGIGSRWTEFLSA